MLYAVGKVERATYEALNRARKHRNNFAHGAKIDLTATEDGMTTMLLMLERVCEAPIQPPLTSMGVSW